MWGAPLCVGGLWEAWVCGVLSGGFGSCIWSLSWSFSGTGLLLLGVGVVPSGRVRDVWVGGDNGVWEFNSEGVSGRVWEGCPGWVPRCSLLGVLRRGRISQGVRMIVWCVFPRRVRDWWRVPMGGKTLYKEVKKHKKYSEYYCILNIPLVPHGQS